MRMPRSGKHTHVKTFIYDHCVEAMEMCWSWFGDPYIFNFFAVTLGGACESFFICI